MLKGRNEQSLAMLVAAFERENGKLESLRIDDPKLVAFRERYKQFGLRNKKKLVIPHNDHATKVVRYCDEWPVIYTENQELLDVVGMLAKGEGYRQISQDLGVSFKHARDVSANIHKRHHQQLVGLDGRVIFDARNISDLRKQINDAHITSRFKKRYAWHNVMRRYDHQVPDDEGHVIAYVRSVLDLQKVEKSGFKV